MTTPTPGSPDATAAGCLCPILDNNHGKWKPWTGAWWVNDDCPVHGRGDETAESGGQP